MKCFADLVEGNFSARNRNEIATMARIQFLKNRTKGIEPSKS